MNAYERRIVHNAFKDDPEIITWSPPDDARIKRITLRRRPQVAATSALIARQEEQPPVSETADDLCPCHCRPELSV